MHQALIKSISRFRSRVLVLQCREPHNGLQERNLFESKSGMAHGKAVSFDHAFGQADIEMHIILIVVKPEPYVMQEDVFKAQVGVAFCGVGRSECPGDKSDIKIAVLHGAVQVNISMLQGYFAHAEPAVRNIEQGNVGVDLFGKEERILLLIPDQHIVQLHLPEEFNVDMADRNFGVQLGRIVSGYPPDQEILDDL